MQPQDIKRRQREFEAAFDNASHRRPAEPFATPPTKGGVENDIFHEGFLQNAGKISAPARAMAVPTSTDQDLFTRKHNATTQFQKTRIHKWHCATRNHNRHTCFSSKVWI